MEEKWRQEVIKIRNQQEKKNMKLIEEKKKRMTTSIQGWEPSRTSERILITW